MPACPLGLGPGLFFSSEGGEQTTAVLSSFSTACKRLHIAPFAYLRDVLDRISVHPAKRLGQLLPDERDAAHDPTQNPTA